jgi:hypothetical protein
MFQLIKIMFYFGIVAPLFLTHKEILSQMSKDTGISICLSLKPAKRKIRVQ